MLNICENCEPDVNFQKKLFFRQTLQGFHDDRSPRAREVGELLYHLEGPVSQITGLLITILTRLTQYECPRFGLFFCTQSS